MRRVVVALIVVAAHGTAAQADAAPRSLAFVQGGGSVALAGGLALFADERGGLAVSVEGGTSRRVLTLSAPRGQQMQVPRLLASSTRVGLAAMTDGWHYAQAFSGPPAGPWTALGPATNPSNGDAFTFIQAVVGDRLFAATGVFDSSQPPSWVVRDPDPRPLPFGPPPTSGSVAFAGDLVAFATTPDGADPRFPNRRLVVRNWSTGAVLTQADLPESITSVDVRHDGRALAMVDEERLYDVPAGGAPRWLVVNAERARFAGDRIVFARRNALRVIEPSGQIRRFGTDTHSLGAFTTDDANVLWIANQCLLVAPVTAAAAHAPASGPCPRGEVEVAIAGPHRVTGRTVALRLRCVVAPCAGTLRLRFEDGPALGPAQPYKIAQGHAGTVRLQLTKSALRTLNKQLTGQRIVTVAVKSHSADGYTRDLGYTTVTRP